MHAKNKDLEDQVLTECLGVSITFPLPPDLLLVTYY